MALIEALEQKRGDMSIPVFAEKLGIHHTTYYRILMGEREIGLHVQKQILAQFPELAHVVLAEMQLAREAPTSAPDAL
jgi:DNA-binding IclR family transcriptional regulator